jgi:hypothetical protein
MGPYLMWPQPPARPNDLADADLANPHQASSQPPIEQARRHWPVNRRPVGQAIKI